MILSINGLCYSLLIYCVMITLYQNILDLHKLITDYTF